jgi:hypothetical protein
MTSKACFVKSALRKEFIGLILEIQNDKIVVLNYEIVLNNIYYQKQT